MAILENTDDASNTIATTPLDVQAAAAQATVATLLAATGNQYLNPDYLSPMPSDLDSKSCPLALLAKTCSQIGADSSDIGTVVGNGSSSVKIGSSIHSNKSNPTQHRDGILKISSYCEQSSNEEHGRSRSKGYTSPAIVISTISASIPSKSPSHNIVSQNGHSDKRHSDLPNEQGTGNKVSSHPRSSSIETNLMANTASPTKNTLSLSSPSSSSTTSSLSHTSPSRKSFNENSNGNTNINSTVGHSKVDKDRSMPPLIGRTVGLENENKKELTENAEILEKRHSTLKLLAHSSKSEHKFEQDSKSAKESDPVLKNGLEALAGYPRDLPLGTYPRHVIGDATSSHISESLQNYLLYNGMSHLNPNSTNSASPASQHLALALAAGSCGRNPFMPNNVSALSAGAISNRSHPHTPSGICRDPMCRDPICPTSVRNQQLLAAATGNWSASSVLSHYSSVLSAHHRDSVMSSAQRQAIQASMLAAAAAGPPGSSGGALPYVCNWVSGTDYCGKRFVNSEELLVHLKTHTNLSTSDFRYASLLSSSLTSTTTAGASSSSIIPPHGSITASMASRYHPYARPESNIGSFPPNFPSSLTIPPSAAAPASYLNPYASLYSSLFARPPLI